jgi:hypothetical protein
MLRARVIADLSGAIKGKEVGSDSVDPPEIDDDQFLNDVAVYLEGRSSEEERRRLINAMARAPERRAMVESAAEFLHELEVASEPMPPDILAEAKALFAPSPPDSPQISTPDIAGSRIERSQMIPPHIASPQVLPPSPMGRTARSRFWRTRPQWTGAAGIAALLMVGAVGTFEAMRYTESNDAPALRLAAFKQVEQQRQSAGKDASRAPAFDAPSAPTAVILPAALDNQPSEKNALDHCDVDPTSSGSAHTKRLLAELGNSHRDRNTMSNARDGYLEYTEACRVRALLEQAQPTLANAQPAAEAALALADPIKPSLVLAKPILNPDAVPPKEKARDESANCDGSRTAQAERGQSSDGPTTTGKNRKGSTVSIWAIAELMARTGSLYGGARGRRAHDPCAVRASRSEKPDRPSAQAAPTKPPAQSAAEANSWSPMSLSTGIR